MNRDRMPRISGTPRIFDCFRIENKANSAFIKSPKNPQSLYKTVTLAALVHAKHMVEERLATNLEIFTWSKLHW